MTMTEQSPTIERHPVRGALWGLLLGVGVAIYLILFTVISVSIVTPVIVIVVCGALGLVWASVAPPRTKSQ